MRRMSSLSQILGIVLAWMVIYALFGMFKPNTFFALSGFENVVRQALAIGIGAVGMTYIIVAGGIDLSAGSVVGLCTVTGALTFKLTGNPLLAFVACLGTGILCGAINGATTVALRTGPFIVTLVMMLAYNGLATGLAENGTVSAQGWTSIQSLTSALDEGSRWQLIPPGAWLWLAFLVVMGLMMTRTVFGRNVVAVGSNPHAAEVAGVRVRRIQVATYTLGGLFFAVAALMKLSRAGQGDFDAGKGEELQMIAAAVIGGASLTGGQGNVWGAAIGALIMSTINMGCNILGVDNWVQNILTGAIILAAVALDRLRMTRSEADR